MPVAWTNFFPVNRVYDFLHEFLDFENAKRLIVYGIILIVMMIVRPDGLLTRDSLRRVCALEKRPWPETRMPDLSFDRRPDQTLRRLLCAERSEHAGRAAATSMR